MSHSPESVRNVGVSDQAAGVDSLGFKPYVTAIANFLLNPETKPPLTLSIEGEWGSGKSSFMKQLDEYLRDKGERTVWFNAWRHDKAEAVWAAFALSFIKQISTPQVQTPQAYCQVFSGHLKLAISRFDLKKGWLGLIQSAALGIFVICAAIAIPFILLIYGMQGITLLIQTFKSPIQFINNLLYFFGITLSGSLSVAGLFALLKKLPAIIGSPKLNLIKYLKSPDYTKQSAFIEEFHEDFSKIVDAYIGDDRVFVFIDDLDRCEHPKSADLMQAINLMIADDPSVVFILGMDREKIAASLAVKYESILAHLPSETSEIDPDILSLYSDNKGLAYGYTFIEKFVQIPFLIPKSSEQNIDNFVSGIYKNSINNKNAKNRPSEQKKNPREIKLKNPDLTPEEMKPIIKMVAPALDYNPRRIKQFINTFHVKLYIAKNTGLLNAKKDDDGNTLTPEQLGKFTAICLRWPILLSYLEKNRRLLQMLHRNSSYKNTIKIKSIPDTEGLTIINSLKYWLGHDKLRQLIAYGSHEDSNSPNGYQFDPKFSLEKVDVAPLLQVSPRAFFVDGTFTFGSQDTSVLPMPTIDHNQQAETPQNEISSLPPEFNIEMVDIPAGKFMMGSDENDNEKPIHEVTVSAFQMAKYPVTQAQYKAVIGLNPSNFLGDSNPVESVNWFDAQAFCKKLSELTGQKYRLPTEAEWEYACRARTQTRFSFGDDENQLGDYAWFLFNSNNTTHPVREKLPNEWELYDMHGNVWEWCADQWHESYENKPEDLKQNGNMEWTDGNITKESCMILRGATYCSGYVVSRLAYRHNFAAEIRSRNVGFRVGVSSP
jgi:formylglycine-generating enzyme required for sulfatase activity